MKRAPIFWALTGAILALTACGKPPAGAPGAPATTTAAAATSQPATAVDTNLIHRYSFTNAAKDSKGSIDGILKNSAKVAEGRLVLDNGTKSSPDETLAYVEFPKPLLPPLGSVSIVFWFTAKDIQAFARIIDFGDKDGTEGLTFIYYTPSNGGNARAAITGSDVGSKTYIDADALDDGKEHMVAIVIDDKIHKLLLYVDGKPAGEPADLGENTLNKVKPVHSWLGRSAFDADGGMTASINELRVYATALTREDVAAQAAAGPDQLPAK